MVAGLSFDKQVGLHQYPELKLSVLPLEAANGFKGHGAVLEEQLLGTELQCRCRDITWVTANMGPVLSIFEAVRGGVHGKQCDSSSIVCL